MYHGNCPDAACAEIPKRAAIAMPLTLTFHESQYPERLAALSRRALRARRLPGRLLYDSPAQAQRWLAYHQAYSPSRTEPQLLTLYERAFRAAVRTAGPQRPLHYVSLGCGGGNKDALFVRSAGDLGASPVVSPMDTSPALVLETLLRLEEAFPRLAASPMVVDLAAEPDIGAWLSQQETRGACRIFGCFGIIPNFDYAACCPTCGACCGTATCFSCPPTCRRLPTPRRWRASCPSTTTRRRVPGSPGCWTAWGFRRRTCRRR